MRLGREILIKPIKCENKIGNDVLKEAHFAVNDVLYQNSTKLISRDNAENIQKFLAQIGKTIRELELPKNCNPKREELLSKMIEIWKSLEQYKKSKDSTATDSDNDRMYRRALAEYMKVKDSKNLDLYIQCLKDNKKLYDEGMIEAKYTTKRELKNLQEEILEQIKDIFILR